MYFNCCCISPDIMQLADGIFVPVGECEAVLIDRSGSRVACIHQTLALIKYLKKAERWIDALSHRLLI